MQVQVQTAPVKESEPESALFDSEKMEKDEIIEMVNCLFSNRINQVKKNHLTQFEHDHSIGFQCLRDKVNELENNQATIIKSITESKGEQKHYSFITSIEYYTTNLKSV